MCVRVSMCVRVCVLIPATPLLLQSSTRRSAKVSSCTAGWGGQRALKQTHFETAVHSASQGTTADVCKIFEEYAFFM